MSIALDILRSIPRKKVTVKACKRGHLRTPENIYCDPKTGCKVCKLCRAEHMKAYYRRRKAKKVAA